MKAKDTVMKLSEIENLFVKTRKPTEVDPEDHQMFINMLRNLCSIQTEISFPLGKKQGITEVVEWVKSHKAKTTDGLTGVDARTSESCVVIKEKDWQAKLKEWLK